MRITAVRIDGYGVLSDVRIADLPGGLTVFVGANEAGKSTLLDFVRGVLFGFPDRRHRAAFHEPLKGGRHGGAIELLDDGGEAYLIERHVGEGAPVVSLLGGAMRDPGSLSTILGGADDTLFRSVFAFGLGELSSFESLDRDEIRDLVFSAGVLGAGRSATRASKVISQRRSLLVRQRRGEAVANGLRHELDELDTSLRAARRSSVDLHALERERERCAEALASAKVAAEAVHRRRRELDRLQSAWPLSRRRASAQAALEPIAIEGAELEAVRGVTATIERLAHDRSGRAERLRRRDELVDERDSIERELDLGRRALSLDEGRSFLPLAPDDESAAARISEDARAVAVERRAVTDQRSSATSDLGRSAAQLDAAVGGSPPRDELTLRSLTADLGELRVHLRDRDRDERAVGSDSPRHRRDSSDGSQRWAPVFATTTLVVVALAALAFGASGHKPPVALVVAIAVVTIALGTVGVVAPRARGTGRSGRGATGSSEIVGRRNREIARLSTILGLSGELTDARLDTLATALNEERDARRTIDELGRVVERDRARVAAGDEALARLDDADAALADEAGELCARHGIGSSENPAALTATFSTLRHLIDLAEAGARVRDEIASIETVTAQDRNALVCAATAANIANPEGTDTDLLLDTMIGAIDRARAHSATRADLERSIEQTSADLEIAIGSGEDAERLLDELTRGAVLEWENEQERLAGESADVDARHDASLDALREAERKLDELRSSAEVATIELRRSGVAESLERALSEWAVLGVAEALLDDALDRYERDRQPEVIALASTLFSEVTGGRYVALVPWEDIEGARRRGIEAITPSGSRVGAGDLSRGTAEQLYLCLRLAFASTFAERSVALPLVLDDVLVNFDPSRARAMAQVIAKTAATHQVLAFTCHPHIVEHFASTGDIHVVELG